MKHLWTGKAGLMALHGDAICIEADRQVEEIVRDRSALLDRAEKAELRVAVLLSVLKAAVSRPACSLLSVQRTPWLAEAKAAIALSDPSWPWPWKEAE